MQHIGPLIITTEQVQTGQVTGTTTVKSGGILIVKGQLSDGLIIEEGGQVVLEGQCSRNVLNHGRLHLIGQICGKLLGNPAVNQNELDGNQIGDTDLPVPFTGTTTSWSSSSYE